MVSHGFVFLVRVMAKADNVKRAAIISAIGRDGMSRKDVAAQFGVSRAYVDKIARGSEAAVSILRMTTTQGFIDKSAHVMDMVLDRMMDQEVINKASLNQLAVTYGILNQNKLLQEGKATVIFGNERREQVNDLAVQLMAEAKRRGVVIDATATEVRDD